MPALCTPGKYVSTTPRNYTSAEHYYSLLSIALLVKYTAAGKKKQQYLKTLGHSMRSLPEHSEGPTEHSEKVYHPESPLEIAHGSYHRCCAFKIHGQATKTFSGPGAKGPDD